MRLKMFVATLAALFLSGTAVAQGSGQPPQRRPEAPEPSVAPIRVEGRVAPTLSAIPPAIQPENTWILDLSNGGRVAIQLRPDMAPGHVERIKTLTRRGFYNGIAFHRVVEGFMAQGGDPTAQGSGGSDLPDLKAEFNALPHLRGSVAAARTADNVDSANSQFYIMFVPRLSMDGEYTVFGRVVSGMQHVDAIQRGTPPTAPTRIVRASLGSDNAPPPTAAEIAAVNQAAAPTTQPLRVLDVQSLTGAAPVPPAQTPPAQTPPTATQPTPQN